MAKQQINIGTSPNSKNGDPLRTSFIKINENFTELYDTVELLGGDVDPSRVISANVKGNIISSTDSIIINASTGTTFNTSGSQQLKQSATSAPTVDMLSISNAGFPITTAGISAVQVNYVGGAAAVESSAFRVDLTPGTTSGGIWNAYRIALSAASTTGVTLNGIKFDSNTPAGGTDNAIYVGTGWDNIINLNGTSIISGTGAGSFTTLSTSSGLTNALTASTGLSLDTGTTYDASAARTLTVSTNTRIRTINFIIDGSGTVITTGIKGEIVVDFSATILSWDILGDAVGSLTVNISKATYANFPTFTASGGTSPALASVQKNQATINWTGFTTITAGDILRFTVAGTPATVTRVTVSIQVQTNA